MANANNTPSAITPDPWSLDDCNDYFVLTGNDGVRIADIYAAPTTTEDEEATADAYLIAAAPDLLRVARECLSACETRIEVLQEECYDLGLDPEFDEEASDICDQIGHWEAMKKVAEAAIFKVEGRE